MARMPPASRAAPAVGIAPPGAQHRSAADDQNCKRHGNEEDIQAKERARAEPLHQPHGAVRRLILRRLEVPDEKRGHEEHGRQDKEQLRGGDGALEGVHECFVRQSLRWVKPDGTIAGQTQSR